MRVGLKEWSFNIEDGPRREDLYDLLVRKDNILDHSPFRIATYYNESKYKTLPMRNFAISGYALQADGTMFIMGDCEVRLSRGEKMKKRNYMINYDAESKKGGILIEV